MELYLLRHGIAEEGRPGQPDSDRALTHEGKKKLRGVLRTAFDAGVAPSLIVSSPFRRAVETAGVAAEVLGYRAEIAISNVLIPASHPEAVWEELRAYENEEQLMLCGHEPLFGQLAAFLLNSPALRVDFKKGALLRADLERVGKQPLGVLKWMLIPKVAG